MHSLRAHVTALAIALLSAATAAADSAQWNHLYDWQQIPPINTKEAPLVNQSSRGLVGTGNNLLIGGFVIQTTTNVLVRGIGPSMAQFGITNPLSAPQVVLFKATNVNGQTVQTQIATNSNWVNATAQPEPVVLEDVMRRIGAFSLSRTSGDAAIYMRLEPGIYTAHLVGRNGATGVGLLEIYLVPPEIDPFDPSWWGVELGYPWMSQPWAKTGLAPRFASGGLIGYRLELTADAETSLFFAAAPEWVNRPGQPRTPRTVVLPRTTVIPISPDETGAYPYLQDFGGALDSNGWAPIAITQKSGANTWEFVDAASTPYVTGRVMRRFILTFTTANSGTFVIKYSKGVYNAEKQGYDETTPMGESTGTFVFNRLMTVNGFLPSLNDWRAWWIE